MSHPNSKSGRRCLDPNFRLWSTGRSVRIEVATAEDERAIHEFLNAGFVFDEPMNRAVDLQPEDLDVFLVPTLKESLPAGLSVLAVDGDKICGVFVNNLHEIHERKERTLSPEPKSDYAEDFDACTWPAEKFTKIGVMLDHVDALVPAQLPPDVRRYVRLDVLSVHPDYTRNNLARKLTVESCRLAAEAGVQWAQITGSAVATNRVARALNFRPFFHLPLAEYKRAGERVFHAFHDGGEEICSYVARIDELKLDGGL